MMRSQFVHTKNRLSAKSACPWAAKIVRVEGGFMCFGSINDYRVWKMQQ